MYLRVVRVWLVTLTSRLGTGKSLTFLYSVEANARFHISVTKVQDYLAVCVSADGSWRKRHIGVRSSVCACVTKEMQYPVVFSVQC